MTPLYAENDPESKTGLFYNGRYWKIATIPQKKAYIIGFFEGYLISRTDDLTKPNNMKDLLEIYLPDLTYSALISEIDSFYKEDANGPLPIPVALRYTAQKTNGATKEELDAFIARSYKLYAQPPKIDN